MWISRKRFKEMERKIEEMTERIIKLGKIHNGKTFVSELGFQHAYYEHNVESAQTDLLGSVTIQELASLIIDGKPIVREDSVKVRKEFGLK